MRKYFNGSVAADNMRTLLVVAAVAVRRFVADFGLCIKKRREKCKLESSVDVDTQLKMNKN